MIDRSTMRLGPDIAPGLFALVPLDNTDIMLAKPAPFVSATYN
jgi:hypothetical protein